MKKYTLTSRISNAGIKALFLTSCAFIAILIPMRSRGQVPLDINQVSIGAGYSTSNYPKIPATQSGEGIAGQFHVSLLSLLLFHFDPKSSFAFGDIVGGAFSIGARQNPNPTGFSDPLPLDNIWMEFELDYGLQAYLALQHPEMTFGIKWYIHGFLDDANSFCENAGTCQSDFDVINLSTSYKRFALDFSLTSKHRIFNKDVSSLPKIQYGEAGLKYYLKPHGKSAGEFIGFRWDWDYCSSTYTDPGANFKNSLYRVVYGWNI